MRPDTLAAATARMKSGWLTPSVMAVCDGIDDALVGEGTAPGARLVFEAFRHFEPHETRVVILGQDPYHTPGKARGVSFGIARDWVGRRDYSSFGNIVREIESCERSRRRAPRGGDGDLDPRWSTLQHWVDQGVLLLNTRLSVFEGRPMSQADAGWDAVVRATLEPLLLPDYFPCVWLCWGAEASDFVRRLDLPSRSIVIDTSHPSKYSATRGRVPFVGSRWPRTVNGALEKAGIVPIEWL